MLLLGSSVGQSNGNQQTSAEQQGSEVDSCHSQESYKFLEETTLQVCDIEEFEQDEPQDHITGWDAIEMVIDLTLVLTFREYLMSAPRLQALALLASAGLVRWCINNFIGVWW